MNDTPPEFPVTGHFKALYDRLNILIRAVRHRTIIPGPGIDIEQKETGTVIRVRAVSEVTTAEPTKPRWG